MCVCDFCYFFFVFRYKVERLDLFFNVSVNIEFVRKYVFVLKVIKFWLLLLVGVEWNYSNMSILWICRL